MEYTEEVRVVILRISFAILSFAQLTKALLFVDEVGAIVFDIGAHSIRAGYAGEDCPKVRIVELWLIFSSKNSVEAR